MELEKLERQLEEESLQREATLAERQRQLAEQADREEAVRSSTLCCADCCSQERQAQLNAAAPSSDADAKPPSAAVAIDEQVERAQKKMTSHEEGTYCHWCERQDTLMENSVPKD